MLNEIWKGIKTNPIWFGSIGAITGVQGWFAWEFWGAVSADPMHQFGLRTMGLGFVGAEVVALDMASRRAIARDYTAANTLRALWLGLALTNFAADVNALSRVLQAGEVERAQDIAAYEARQREMAALRQQIDAADDDLPDGRLLSVAAYDSLIASKAREAEISQHSPRWIQRRIEEERGALEAARQVALQVAAWETQLRDMEHAPETTRAAPEAGAIEFAPLASVLTGVARSATAPFGGAETTITPEQVRSGVAVAATIMMKLLLTFGVFVGLERSRHPYPERPSTPQAPPAEERPATARVQRPARSSAAQVVRFTRAGRR
jgi:hypothetical protein